MKPGKKTRPCEAESTEKEKEKKRWGWGFTVLEIQVVNKKGGTEKGTVSKT